MPVRAHGTHLETPASRRLSWLLLVLPFVLTGYLLSSGESGVAKLWRQADRIEILRADIERLRRENTDLAERATLLKDDPGTIERIARERYGMVKENESVYMVYPSPPGNPE